MSWQSLCDAYKDPNSELHSAIDELLKKVADNPEAELQIHGPEVGRVKAVELEVSKLLMCITEKELKAKEGLKTLPKSLIKGVPTVSIPTEDGSGTEVAYIFKHPSSELREARLKVVLRASMYDEDLGKNESLFSGQASKVFSESLGAVKSELQLDGLLAKLSSPTQTYEEWATLKLAKSPESTPAKLSRTSVESIDGGAENVEHDPEAAVTNVVDPGVDSDDEDDCPLSGLAAHEVVVKGSLKSFFKPLGGMSNAPSTSKKSAIARQFSGLSRQGKSATGVSGQSAASAQSSAGYGDNGEDLTGMALVQHWKERTPVAEILMNKPDAKVDGRTIDRLLRVVESLSRDETKRMEHALLNAHHSLCTTAKDILKADIAKVPLEKLHCWLRALHEEGVPLTETIMLAVLKRRAKKLEEDKEYKTLFAVLNPFTAAVPFDGLEPCLSGIQASLHSKVCTSQKTMMETLLYNLLEAGEEGKDQVLALAKMALALLDDEEQVDFGEIDDGVAKLLLEQRSVWVTMVALLDATFCPEHQDLKCHSKRPSP
eukprot:6490942-Amphidinium_carterae.1